MPKRLGKFELPKSLKCDESVSNDTYAKFIAEPFEIGYGHTMGNALRRVLLSSIEGAAICSVKIEGVSHEFQSIDGVVEDVTEIVETDLGKPVCNFLLRGSGLEAFCTAP